jgi:tetratricopeptide (TPR) repeat protein
MAHSALAEAWLTLGYDNRAAKEAKRGYELSGALNREQKLLIDGRYHEASHQWDEAIKAYRVLFDFYPDNVEYGLRLARSQWEGAKYDDSSGTAQVLAKLPPPTSNDPRIALALAKAEFSLGNLALAQKSVASAAEQAKQNGAVLIVAEANLLQVENSSPSHGLAVDQAHADEAYRICESVGDLDCAAWALYRKAFVDDNNAASRPQYEQALQLFTRTGDLRGVANVQIGLGRLSWLHGRDNEARRSFVQAQATCEKIDDQSCRWKAILHEGNVFAEAGNMPEAGERFQRAMVIAQKAGESGGAAWAMANLGEVRQLQGDLTQALTLFQNSAEINRQHFGKPGALGMAYAGSALLDQGRLDDARHILEESLAIAHTYMGEGRDIGNATMTLARVDLAEQRPAEAESKLRTIVAYRESIDDKQTAAAYNDFLALALLAQGKVTEAQTATAHARQLLGA